MKIRPLTIRDEYKRLQNLLLDYQERQGLQCELHPDRLVVLPRWNRNNLTANKPREK